jgi:hypothetical protein
MRRSRTTFTFFALLLCGVASILPGCGGSNNKVVSITLTPSPVSVAYGQSNITLTATAVNSNNATVSTTFTFASSNTAAVSISPSGEICGGTWDANFVTCSKPASLTPQTATITVTAQTVAATVQAYVHENVDSIVISSGPGVGSAGPICATSTQCTCTSLSTVFGSTPSATLPQFKAKAFSNDSAVCTPKSLSVPCDITSDLTGGSTKVSPFQWSSSDTTIATIDTTGTSTAGTVTPIGPGQANIFASTAGVNSSSVPFVTCPVSSITLTATNGANNGLGPIAISGSQALSAAVTDTAGKTITYSSTNTTSLALNYPALSWLSTDLYAAASAVQTQTVKTTVSGVTSSESVPLPTATANGATDGVTSLVTSCTPPSCNKNLFPVYSNPIVATKSGSDTAVAYIASAQSTRMLAINVSTGAKLTTFSATLPSAPNSFLFNRKGTKAVLGSSSGVFVFDPSAVTFTTFSFNGKVLAISPDGVYAVVSGQVAGQSQNSIGILNLSTSALAATFPVVAGTVTGADFSIDSRYLWVAVTPTGSTTGRIYVYTMAVGSSFFAVNFAANDVAFLTSGPFVYLAGDTSTASITARATCLGGQQAASTVSVTNGFDLPHGVVDVQLGTAPTNLRALPSGAGILALDPPNIDVIALASSTTSFGGCPPTLSGSESLTAQALGLASTTLNQFLVTPNSSYAVLTSTDGKVILVNLANLQSLKTTTITLQNSAVLQDPTTGLFFQGDIPADSSGFIVGGSDKYLHEISTSTGTEFNTLSLSGLGLLEADGVTDALPNLVAIRNE